MVKMKSLRIDKWVENLASQARDDWMDTFIMLGYSEGETTPEEFKAIVKHCIEEGAQSNEVLFDAFVDIAVRLAEDVEGFGEVGYLDEFFEKCGCNETGIEGYEFRA